jgi:hypothetical protein
MFRYSALKIQLHGMFFDTSFNSLDTVLSNLFIAFKDAALRCFSYMKSLSAASQPSFETLKSEKNPTFLSKAILGRSMDKHVLKELDNLTVSMHFK